MGRPATGATGDENLLTRGIAESVALGLPKAEAFDMEHNDRAIIVPLRFECGLGAQNRVPARRARRAGPDSRQESYRLIVRQRAGVEFLANHFSRKLQHRKASAGRR